MNDTLLLYSLAWITQPLHWWLLLLFSLTYGLSLRPPYPSLFLFLHPFSSFFPSHSFTYIFTVYLLLRRPQAGDDLRLLADGLAGELLQYCHDHQAGGSGKGRCPFPLSCDLSSRLWRWMEGLYFWSALYHSLYIRRAAPPCVVGGNGCRCLIMSDHLFALVTVLQGQNFDVYEGPWRNIVVCVLLTIPASVEYNRLLF